MQTIDLEAHFYTKAAFDYLATRSDFPKFVKLKDHDGYHLQFAENINLFQDDKFIDILCDLGDNRLKAMRTAQLDTQILSFSSPGIDECFPDIKASAKFATELNDIVHLTTKKYPDNFKGFATLCPYHPEQGVKELERCVEQLGFVGWLAHANFGEGKYLDNKEYWPLLEAAEALDVPIYVHPTVPLTPSFAKHGFSLAGPAMGFQFEAALCLLRMIYSGVFDQFPKLKVILGHMGEAIPFLMPERIDWAYANPNISTLPGFIADRPKISLSPNEVIKRNVFFTTSGRFSKPLLNYVIEVMGEDRILLATDYPYENLQQSMDFIRDCGQPVTVIEKICAGNWQQHFS